MIRRMIGVRTAIGVLLTIGALPPTGAQAQGFGDYPVIYRPAKGAKDLRAVLFNWTRRPSKLMILPLSSELIQPARKRICESVCAPADKCEKDGAILMCATVARC